MSRSKPEKAGPNEPVLRVSYIWNDEVMSDVVLSYAEPVTLGTTNSAMIIVPELGLPDNFEIFRPGARGYVMTLGTSMRGELELNRQKQKVSDFVGSPPAGNEPGFHGSNIGPGDFGVIELDASGQHSLFFQFVKTGPPLPTSPMVRDSELLLPAFAFAVVLVGFFLVYALGFFNYQGPSFLWPDRKVLVADYLLSRPAAVEEEPEPEIKAGMDDGEEKAEPASSNGAAGKSGGEGETERKRVETPDIGEPDEPLPTRIQVGLLNKKSREAMDKIRNRGGFDKKLGNMMARLQGPANGGSAGGYGDGKGTGVGSGNGTGTLTRGTGKGPGGGGKAHADVLTQRKLNTGGKRPPKGVGGTGVKEVAVKMKAGKASGSLGGLTAEQIRKVVNTRARAIRSCYQRQLQRSPGLSGKVVIGWKIDAAGKVSRAKVRSTTLKNGSAEDCMVRAVNSMKFPSPKGGGTASVTFPFVFSQN